MRYSIIPKGLSQAQIETEAKRAGARNITKTKLLGQVFCDLSTEQAKALSAVPGLLVKPVKVYTTDQVMTALPPVETFSDVFYLLRSYFTPPLTGTGLTVAVLEAGHAFPLVGLRYIRICAPFHNPLDIPQQGLHQGPQGKASAGTGEDAATAAVDPDIELRGSRRTLAAAACRSKIPHFLPFEGRVLPLYLEFYI